VREACDSNLAEIALALRAPRGLAGRLDCGQQKCNQDSDDRDHDQEFNERESVSNLLSTNA
jgi:hypothetical protein